MPSTLQHKLLQIELPPPPGNWEGIVARLDQEFDTREAMAADHINSLELPPPTDAWTKIVAGLEETPEAIAPAKVIRLNWKRWAAAAIFIGIASTLFVLYNRQDHQANDTDSIAVVKEELPRKESIIPATPSNPVGIKKAENNETTTPVKLAMNNRLQKHPIRSSLAVQEHIGLADITEPAAVSAPLLRDANGNVIMDLSLLTTASNNYISVTGPNGEQTRISSKFANYLMYLNKSAGEQEEYLDYLIRNSNFWKTRFDQWRNKILEQGNFIPSSANFFDILELKELIKDNQ